MVIVYNENMNRASWDVRFICSYLQLQHSMRLQILCHYSGFILLILDFLLNHEEQCPLKPISH